MKEIIEKLNSEVELVIAAIYAFSIILALMELISELWKKKITRWRLKEMWASFSVFVPQVLTESAGVAIMSGIFIWVAQFIPWKIPVNGYTMVLAVVVIDFLYYWEHRMEHRIRILWSYHSIHHSSPIYNYTTALRVSFIDNFVAFIFFLPAVLAGFHPIMVILAIGVMLIYQFWLHTQLIGKLGVFEKVFMTPSQHRVHHGSDDIYLDKNYGAIFSLWDRMFGTSQEEIFKPKYGLTTQIATTNPIKIHAHEYVNIVKDLKSTNNLKTKWKYLFKPPGWKPKFSNENIQK